MSCILVTGAAGFIGSHVAERLLGLGEEVVGTDNFDHFYAPERKRRRLTPFLEKENFHFHEANLCDERAMRQVFESHSCSRVVHLAALAGVLPSLKEPMRYEQVNVQGTVLLLELCKEFGVEQFVFGSSSSVYGADCPAPFKESDAAACPISPYGATKRMGELIAFTYHHLYNIHVTCLRFFTVYGPWMRPDLAIHKFATLMMRGEELPIYGDGNSLRDYTYIDDIVDGVVAALKKPFDYEIINLGRGEPVVLSHVVKLLEENLGKKATLAFLPPQPGDAPLTHADISKAKNLLGYEPKVNIEDGIRRFCDWFKSEWQLGAPL